MQQPADASSMRDSRADASTEATSFIRIPELDGLRGIAILAVMTGHFLSFAEGYGMFQAPTWPALHWAVRLQYCGWLGVDLFYALSGFLITGILADGKGQSRYFRNFYVRRVLRIFPAYYLLLLAWVVIEPYFSPGNRGTLNPGYPPWLWTYASNVLISLQGWLSIPVPLRHLWSLAVEEQFYLLWPLVIFLLDRRKAIGLCVLLMLAGPFVRIVLDHAFTPFTASYVSLPARLDSLAVGALMALLWREYHDSGRLLQVTGLVAIGTFLLTAAIFIFQDGLDGQNPFDRIWGLSIFDSGFACVILMSAASRGPAILKRLLRGRTLSWFGKYSYGLYLWHPPVCLFLYSTRLMTMLQRTYSQHSSWLLIVLIYATPMIGSIAVAYASWHLWEKRFLDLKNRLGVGHVPKAEVQPV